MRILGGPVNVAVAPRVPSRMSRWSPICLAAVCVLAHASATAIADPPPAGGPRLVHAEVVAAVGDGAARRGPIYARADQRVTLYAVVTAETAGVRTRYSDAPAVELAGKRAAVQPLARLPGLALRWQRIEPAVATMTNGATPAEFHFAAIDYRATAITGATTGALLADVRPTLTPVHDAGAGRGLGTMRYQLTAALAGREVASPGISARRGAGSGGLTDAVLRVSLRRDDSFLGYMTEMYNQPYIWASGGTSDARHQSERLEGSDCADLMIYGQRRLGRRVAYSWTGGLPQVTRKLAAGTRAADGVYRDARGQALPFTAVGDLVLFPRHVGALAVDRGQPGVLDDQDLMMHTLFDSPKEQAIADSGYADTPVELRRFK